VRPEHVVDRLRRAEPAPPATGQVGEDGEVARPSLDAPSTQLVVKGAHEVAHGGVVGQGVGTGRVRVGRQPHRAVGRDGVERSVGERDQPEGGRAVDQGHPVVPRRAGVVLQQVVRELDQPEAVVPVHAGGEVNERLRGEGMRPGRAEEAV